jgi:glycosyltransferase involved in cell wall biosynthesis
VRKPRLLYVVVEDWAFISNRLPMARAARDAGFEVHVATRVGKDAAALRAEGFVLHDVPFARGALSPLAILRTIAAIRDVKRRVRPTVSHHVSMQPTIYGSLASLGHDDARINALTGLGFAFTSESPKAKVLRPVMGRVLRLLLNRSGARTLVQNTDDRDALLRLGVSDERMDLIEGSGVDLEIFHPMPEPAGPITVGFVGRLLGDKGIHTLLAAHREMRAQGEDVALAIAGFPDPGNPTSVSAAEIEAWKADPSIRFHGKIDHARAHDIARFWAGAHIAALPSRREGLPKTLIEAAGCGRPLIAADVPGCRSVVIPEQTGLLVSVDDPSALARAIQRLASSVELRAQLGAGARRHTESRFAAELIGHQVLSLYQQVAREYAEVPHAA